ncbi:MAG: hypothetical protein JO266_17205 [Acidobacteria bacterium]|nr:hypothetical protein [Acidobacteriota bacterium]
MTHLVLESRAFPIRKTKLNAYGEGRVQAAPMARQQEKKLAAVTTGLAEQPGLPCATVLTVSFALSPGTGLSCSRHQRDQPADLASASGGQDHTTSPSAKTTFV